MLYKIYVSAMFMYSILFIKLVNSLFCFSLFCFFFYMYFVLLFDFFFRRGGFVLFIYMSLVCIKIIWKIFFFFEIMVINL